MSSPLLFIVIIALIVVSLGLFSFPSSPGCTEDEKMCLDGSSVARIPPRCEFAPCPTTLTSCPGLEITDANFQEIFYSLTTIDCVEGVFTPESALAQGRTLHNRVIEIRGIVKMHPIPISGLGPPAAGPAFVTASGTILMNGVGQPSDREITVRGIYRFGEENGGTHFLAIPSLCTNCVRGTDLYYADERYCEQDSDCTLRPTCCNSCFKDYVNIYNTDPIPRDQCTQTCPLNCPDPSTIKPSVCRQNTCVPFLLPSIFLSADQDACEAAGGEWVSAIHNTFRCAVGDQQTCEANGGLWGRQGLLGGYGCTLPYPEGGNPCTSSSECYGGCIIEQQGNTQGTCRQYDNVFGCFIFIDGPGICVD